MAGFIIVLAVLSAPPGKIAIPQATKFEPTRSVTLLVHGLKVNLAAPIEVWGQPIPDGKNGRWSGLIGSLQEAGHRFGGVIRPRGSNLRLPDCLNAPPDFNPQAANLFALEFSSGANTDGLAYKTLELAECLAELRRFTGCQKVSIVAHSAGGLVARTYLQSALPKVPYAGDVDRLITISTPHLGSELAKHLGDFLGTRATAIKPDGELVRRLNDELDLPPDVLFASIVVRGVAIGSTGLTISGEAYEPVADRELLERLPVDFRLGGDQVVHVISQNLRLTNCAKRYEAATGRPVQYLLARVSDPTPGDRCLTEKTVHEAAAGDPLVALQVELLLQDHRQLWAPLSEPLLSQWLRLQASMAAYGAIEAEVANRRTLIEVKTTTVESLELLSIDLAVAQSTSNPLRRYRFAGVAPWQGRVLRFSRGSTAVSGVLDLTFDAFGRIVSSRAAIGQVSER